MWQPPMSPNLPARPAENKTFRGDVPKRDECGLDIPEANRTVCDTFFRRSCCFWGRKSLKFTSKRAFSERRNARGSASQRRNRRGFFGFFWCRRRCSASSGRFLFHRTSSSAFASSSPSSSSAAEWRLASHSYASSMPPGW